VEGWERDPLQAGFLDPLDLLDRFVNVLEADRCHSGEALWGRTPEVG
jgi:hypothetical protein